MIEILVALVFGQASISASLENSSAAGLTNAWTVFETDGTYDAATDLLADISPVTTLPDSVAKPDNSMIMFGTVDPIRASFERSDGNRFQAWEYDNGEYFTKTDNNSLDYTDTPHYFVFLIKHSSGAAGTDNYATKGTPNASGIEIRVVAGGTATARYSKAASTVTVTGPTAVLNDDMWHIVQIYRDSSDMAYVCVDGTCGTGVDVSTYGIDNANSLTIGSTFDGSIWYARYDSNDLTGWDTIENKMDHESEVLLGLAKSRSKSIYWSFTRTTGAPKIFSNPYLGDVPAHQPRTSDGFLVELAETNSALQSDAFNVTWTSDALTTITVNGEDTPSDQGTVADGLVGTAVDTQHGVYQSIQQNLNTVYTMSVFAKAGDQDYAWLEADASDCYYYVAGCSVGTCAGADYLRGRAETFGDYCRLSMTYKHQAASGPIDLGIYAAAADTDNDFSGDATNENIWLFRAQVEASYFPTSPIPTTTGSVSRTNDTVLIDPHPTGIPHKILSEEYNSTTNTDLTIYIEVKCLWEDDTELPTSKSTYEQSAVAGTSSGSRNRISFQHGSDGKIYFNFWDDSSTQHRGYTTNANIVKFNQWNSYRLYIDFADLSNMEIWVNDVTPATTWMARSGTATYDTTDNQIKLAANQSGSVTSSCWYKNLRIYNAQVAP
jgi:hypothetical protein